MKQSLNIHWHQTKLGLLALILIELVVAYLLASRAIDTGSWWEYGFGLVLLVSSLNILVKLIGKIVHGKGRPSRA